MEFTAKLIADYLKGTIEGDPEVAVHDVAKIEEATKGTLAFLSNPKYLKYLYNTEASIVLINEDLKLENEVKPTLIRVKDAYQGFAALLDLYVQNKPQKNGIEPNTFVDKSAKIGSDVYLGSFSYVSANARIGNNVKIYPHVFIGENVQINDNTVIYANVSIYEMCIIGKNCIVHSGTVIGSDGFGHAPQDDGSYKKIPQIGNVVIEDDVELGSNVSIDRATMGSTIIRKGAKLDNLIQVAHNVEIGANTVIASQTGIAGSTKIGANCVMAGQVGIVGHLDICEKTIIASQSGVSSNITKPGGIWLGSPVQDISKARRSIAIYRQLPDLRNKIMELEREIARLKQDTKE